MGDATRSPRCAVRTRSFGKRRAARVPLLSSSPRGVVSPLTRAPPTTTLPSPFTDAISTLNDRALRRLLGARAFLRGYDYVRRRAVENVEVGDASARGEVKGTEPEPYNVQLQLTPSGFSSECTCPAFSKINGHC